MLVPVANRSHRFTLLHHPVFSEDVVRTVIFCRCTQKCPKKKILSSSKVTQCTDFLNKKCESLVAYKEKKIHEIESSCSKNFYIGESLFLVK